MATVVVTLTELDTTVHTSSFSAQLADSATTDDGSDWTRDWSDLGGILGVNLFQGDHSVRPINSYDAEEVIVEVINAYPGVGDVYFQSLSITVDGTEIAGAFTSPPAGGTGHVIFQRARYVFRTAVGADAVTVRNFDHYANQPIDTGHFVTPEAQGGAWPMNHPFPPTGALSGGWPDMSSDWLGPGGASRHPEPGGGPIEVWPKDQGSGFEGGDARNPYQGWLWRWSDGRKVLWRRAVGAIQRNRIALYNTDGTFHMPLYPNAPRGPRYATTRGDQNSQQSWQLPGYDYPGAANGTICPYAPALRAYRSFGNEWLYRGTRSLKPIAPFNLFARWAFLESVHEDALDWLQKRSATSPAHPLAGTNPVFEPDPVLGVAVSNQQQHLHVLDTWMAGVTNPPAQDDRYDGQSADTGTLWTGRAVHGVLEHLFEASKYFSTMSGRVRASDGSLPSYPLELADMLLKWRESIRFGIRKDSGATIARNPNNSHYPGYPVQNDASMGAGPIGKSFEEALMMHSLKRFGDTQLTDLANTCASALGNGFLFWFLSSDPTVQMPKNGDGTPPQPEKVLGVMMRNVHIGENYTIGILGPPPGGDSAQGALEKSLFSQGETSPGGANLLEEDSLPLDCMPDGSQGQPDQWSWLLGAGDAVGFISTIGATPQMGVVQPSVATGPIVGIATIIARPTLSSVTASLTAGVAQGIETILATPTLMEADGAVGNAQGIQTIAVTPLLVSPEAAIEEGLEMLVELDFARAEAVQLTTGSDEPRRIEVQREIPVEYIYEEQPLTVLARLVAHGGARIMKNQTRSATLYVYDTSGSTPSSPVHKTALDIDTAIFDTLQTNGWKADRHGYNFRHKLDTRTVFERGGKRFRLEYTVYAELDPALGAEPIDVIVEVILRPVLSRR